MPLCPTVSRVGGPWVEKRAFVQDAGTGNADGAGTGVFRNTAGPLPRTVAQPLLYRCREGSRVGQNGPLADLPLRG